MVQFITRSIRGKLAVSFVLVGLMPILVLGYIGLRLAGDAIERAEFAKLLSERELRKDQILNYLTNTMSSLQYLNETGAATIALDTLYSYIEFSRASPDAPFDISSDVYKSTRATVSKPLEAFISIQNTESSGYEDVLLIGAKNGVVMYSVQQLSDLGANLKVGDLKDSGLAKLWSRVVETGKPAFVDFAMYKVTGKPEAFAGVPIMGSNDKVKGVIALRMGPQHIVSSFSSEHDTNRNAESYLVGQDLLLRSQSKFEKENSVLKNKIETEAAKNALAGKSDTALTRDYRNVSVLSSYAPLGLKGLKSLGADFDWAILSEVAESEMRQPMTVILTYMGMIVMVVAVVVILLVFFLSREFARPITLISQVAERLSKGDLTVTVPEFNRLDEIGALAGAFHSMLESMKTQTGRLYEGIKILSGSATEISTAITQMVTSTAETATSVNQTTATLEEVKQAAMVANDNAMNVARISQQAVAISTEGKKATEATIQGISLIRDQMESVGETVVRLSEHSVAIEQIIASVQDLADQSNLLAVNASIEAARAGEQGRGFAVVAQEIKGLADQSRESTLEVRSILEDVRRSVSAVVMATEQGNKAVDAGVRQSTKAEEAITSLSKVVETSSQAASIIEVSAEQQTAGIDQVALAMSTINKAMQDTLASTQQMEENAKKLEEFGNQLQIIVQTFKIG